MYLHRRTFIAVGFLFASVGCAGNMQGEETDSTDTTAGASTDSAGSVTTGAAGSGATSTTASTTAGSADTTTTGGADTTATTGGMAGTTTTGAGTATTTGSATSSATTGATTTTTTTTTTTGGMAGTTTTGGASGTTTGGVAGTTTTGGASTTWWKPSPSDTWIWDLDTAFTATTATRSPNVSNYSATVYDIDPQNVKASGITTLHNAGKKVVCYVDVGSWEPGRPDAANFDASCICGPGVALKTNGQCPSNSHQMDGRTEWWFDLHDSSCLASTLLGMQKRLQSAHDTGCDAIEPDNLDEWNNPDVAGKAGGGWSTTISDQNTYVTSIAAIAHSLGMGIILKNANGLLVDENTGKATAYQQSIVAAFDGSLNEQCHEYSECDTYAAFGNAGKSMWNAEYMTQSTSSCSGTTYKANYCGTTGMKTLQYSCQAVEVDHLAYVCP